MQNSLEISNCVEGAPEGSTLTFCYISSSCFQERRFLPPRYPSPHQPPCRPPKDTWTATAMAATATIPTMAHDGIMHVQHCNRVCFAPFMFAIHPSLGYYILPFLKGVSLIHLATVVSCRLWQTTLQSLLLHLLIQYLLI